MKTFTFFVSFLFAIIVLDAQDYQISFTGSGQSSSIDSIQVENLSQGTTLFLNGNDVLHLVATVGINSITRNKNLLKVCPNPMTESTFIEFVNTNAGPVSIKIINEIGAVISQRSYQLLKGPQRFEIFGLNAGIYIVNVNSTDWNYAGRIISLSKYTGNTTINFQSVKFESAPKSTPQNTKDLIQMQYNNGEMILIKGFSGIYKRVVTLLPTQSQTINFVFIPCADEDGNNYAVVTIGTQTWMAENLKTTKYNNGTDIPIVTDNTTWINITTPAYCWYNNDQVSFGSIYGALYNWYTVESSNLCPTGWHVPTISEWQTLTDYSGGSIVAGGKLKETGTSHWNSPNTEATNEFGFTALPGGSRNNFDGNYVSNGTWSGWWTPTVVGTNNAKTPKLRYSDGTVYWLFYHYQSGYSVRCLRD